VIKVILRRDMKLSKPVRKDAETHVAQLI
jgi:hypothetical protein